MTTGLHTIQLAQGMEHLLSYLLHLKSRHRQVRFLGVFAFDEFHHNFHDFFQLSRMINAHCAVLLTRIL